MPPEELPKGSPQGPPRGPQGPPQGPQTQLNKIEIYEFAYLTAFLQGSPKISRKSNSVFAIAYSTFAAFLKKSTYLTALFWNIDENRCKVVQKRTLSYCRRL